MKTHRFDGLSFIAGLVITAIGLAFLLVPDLENLIDLFTDSGAWFWPVLFIAIGIAVLAPLTSRTSKEPDQSGETGASSEAREPNAR